MAGYVPAELRVPTNITASYATIVTASGVTVVRHYTMAAVTSHSVFLTREAGAVTNAFEAGTLLAANQTIPRNCWIVLADTKIIQAKADSITTDAPVVGMWGYTYS